MKIEIDKNKLGMWMFIINEATFFSLLILAYLYFRIQATGATASIANTTNLDPVRTGLFSLCLFASSFTVWRAGKANTAGSPGRMRAWLFLTILLGVVFLIGQGLEWAHLFSLGASVSANLFGTTFFTLTGFHGLHVFIGLVMLATLLILAARRGAQTAPASGIETIALYWHFVDVVWVVIFSVVYIATRG